MTQAIDAARLDRPPAGEHASSPAPASATATTYLSVIVPVWNGAAVLPRTLYELHGMLAREPYRAELVIVDDCSGGDAVRVLDAFRRDESVRDVALTVLRNDRNRGKGYSVARGMLAASGDLRVFTDADLAYSAHDVAAVVEALEHGYDVAVACRVLPESRYYMSPSFFPYLFTRHVVSRVYNQLVRALLVRSVLDSQAGLKGFTRAAAELIFRRLTIPRFGFDVECLYIAQCHGQRLAQVPVTFRYDDEPSTVHLLRDGARMLTDLARIRVNGWRHAYA